MLSCDEFIGFVSDFFYAYDDRKIEKGLNSLFHLLLLCLGMVKFEFRINLLHSERFFFLLKSGYEVRVGWIVFFLNSEYRVIMVIICLVLPCSIYIYFYKNLLVERVGDSLEE